MNRDKLINGLCKAACSARLDNESMRKLAAVFGIEGDIGLGEEGSRRFRRYMSNMERQGNMGVMPTDKEWNRVLSEANQAGLTDDIVRHATQRAGKDAWGKRRRGEGWWSYHWRKFKNGNKLDSAQDIDTNTFLRTMNDPRNKKMRAYFYERMRRRLDRQYAGTPWDRISGQGRERVMPGSVQKNSPQRPQSLVQRGWTSYAAPAGTYAPSHF